MYEIKNLGDTIDISINGVITDDGSTQLANEIKTAAKAGIKNVTLHINSYGGSVKGAYDIVTALIKSDMTVTAINEGFAISAASVILAAADVSKAFDYSTAMIHDPLLGNQSLNDTEGPMHNLLQAVKDGIIAIYSKRFKLPIEKISALMTAETSLNAIEQLNIGLVDEIIERKIKPIITKNENILEIYNLYNEAINAENKINENMENNKIVENATTQDNTQEEKQACNDMIACTCPNCGQNLTVDPATSEATVVENATDTTAAETTTETAPAETTTETETATTQEQTACKTQNSLDELTALKAENFILKNGLTEKSEIINESIVKYGVEILEVFKNFIVKEDSNKEKLFAEMKNIVMLVNNEINTEVNTSEKPMDKLALANEIFDIKGDERKRLDIKKNNPELYDELFDIYTKS